MEIKLTTLVICSVIAASTAGDVDQTLQAGTPAAGIVALWSIAPGILGGLAMQLVPDEAKPRRQFIGELLCSGLAGFVVGAFAYAHVGDVWKLGALCTLAGSSGSATLLLGAKLLQQRLRAFSERKLRRVHGEGEAET